MDIKEILKDLKEFSDEGATEYGYEMPLSEVREVIKALERTRWISVSERLPTEEDVKNNRAGYVLVHRKSSAWDFDMCKWHNVEYLELATHWMPVPEVQ